MNGMRSITDAEVAAISAKLCIRDRCLFILGIRTGFRIAELLSLNIGDVWDGKTVTESVCVTKAKMKGKTETRCVPMHSEAAAVIFEYLTMHPIWDRHGKDVPLFRTNPMRRMNQRTFHYALIKACESAGIATDRIATHSMRKSFAMRMNETLKGNMRELQHAMGHKSIANTAKYIEVDTDKVWNAMKNAK